MTRAINYEVYKLRKEIRTLIESVFLLLHELEVYEKGWKQATENKGD